MTTLALAYAIRSDVGLRSNNEDSAFASPRLAAVADGVGGQAAGEIASRLVIDALISLDKRHLERPLRDELVGAVLEGNERIAFVAARRPQQAGMSTTLTAVALGPDGTYVVANIGDSRTYLLRDGVLTQLTRDDSYVQLLIDEGRLDADAARNHPYRSLVLAVLDGADDRQPTVECLTARADDRLLVCSDGVSDVLAADELARHLRDGSGPEVSAQSIVDAALLAGSRDNVTAVVAHAVEREGTAVAW